MDIKPALSRALPIALSIGLSISAVSAVAEDGTSGSVPESMNTCEIVAAQYEPALASATATPMASPVSSPMASQVASPVVEADPLQDDLTAASNSILSCMSSNDLDGLTRNTAGEFRGAWLGVGGSVSDADLEPLLQLMPVLPYELVSVSDASVEGETATATVEYLQGRQVHKAEWTFRLTTVEDENVWQVQTQALQTPEAPADAAKTDLTVADGSFTFSEAELTEGNIVINVTNNGKQPHEVLIVRAPEGTQAQDFAAAPTGIPTGGTFIAQATIPAGSSGTIVLSDLRAGTYTVVDLLPDAAGLPNVSNGMLTTFTVKKP